MSDLQDIQQWMAFHIHFPAWFLCISGHRVERTWIYQNANVTLKIQYIGYADCLGTLGSWFNNKNDNDNNKDTNNNNNNNNNNNETNFLAFPWNIRTILMSSLLESYPGRCLSLLCFLSKSIIFIIVFCFLFFLAFYLSLAETLFVYICSHRAALLGSRHGNFPIFNQKVLSELSLIT